MRAIQLTDFGGPDRLVLTEVPDPVPAPGEILIRLTAAAVNRADVLIRSGGYHSAPPLPAVLGAEGAGTVVALGANVADFAIGDRVVSWSSPGHYAELVAVPAEKATRVPDAVDLTAAAALPVASLSAWYCLHELARVAENDTVLITAAASGVGSIAVQLAKHAGARVIAVVGSADKATWVRKLGADEVVDRHESDIPTQVHDLTSGHGADVTLDLVGGPTFRDALRATARAGRVAAMANVALAPTTIDTRDFYPRNIAIHGFQLNDLITHGWDPRPDLDRLLGLVATTHLTIPIDSAYPLSDAPAAHRRLESTTTRGKVVLLP